MKSSTKTKFKKNLSKQLIESKINELFEYRQIPNLLKLSNIADKHRFDSDLKALQFSIYLLDDYLEHTWNLDERELSRFWLQIDNCLSAFGLTQDEIRDYCKQIDRYQAHETSMRAGKWSTRYTIKYFYYYKSCDVKLLRRLLYRADPNLEDIITLSEWKSYDLITEINDDIEDVFEDMEIFNANRFLVSLLQKGKRQTKLEYSLFMKEMRVKLEISRSVSHLEKNQPDLQLLTIKRINETIQLLNSQMSNIDLTHLQKALIAEKAMEVK